MSEMNAPSGLQADATAGLDSEILRMLMENIPDRIYFKDLASRFVRVNNAHARWLGCASPEAVAGCSDVDFFDPSHAMAARQAELAIIRTGEAVIGRVERITKRDGRASWGSTSKLPWRDETGAIIGTFGLTRDITALKEAEGLLTEERNRLRTIIDHLPSSVFVKDTRGRYIINNQHHIAMLGGAGQSDLLGRTAEDFLADDLLKAALEDDRRVMAEGQTILNQEAAHTARDGTTHWTLTTKVPLYDSRMAITGLVGITHDITSRRHTEEELRLRTSQMEDDLRMACQVQQTFFPQTYPVFPTGVPEEASALRFAHHYEAAATLGGDFFDVIRISDTTGLALICDVMGHGVRAGLLTALIRGVVRETGSHNPDPAHIVGEINRGLIPVLEQTGQPLFATVFCGLFNTQEGILTYANAGHPPPVLLRRATGVVEAVQTPDPEPATGLLPDFPYTRGTLHLEPGDIFLGFTDGLFEAADARGAIFGEEHLHALIAANGHLPLAGLIAALVAGVQAHSGRKVFEDDVCVLAIEAAGNTCVIEPLTYDI